MTGWLFRVVAPLLFPVPAPYTLELLTYGYAILICELLDGRSLV